MPNATISEETQKFLKELGKKMNLQATGQVIDHLVEDMKKPKEEKPMNPPKETKPELIEQPTIQEQEEVPNIEVIAENLTTQVTTLTNQTNILVSHLDTMKLKLRDLPSQEDLGIQFNNLLEKLPTSESFKILQLTIGKKLEDLIKTNTETFKTLSYRITEIDSALTELKNLNTKAIEEPLLSKETMESLEKIREIWKWNDLNHVVKRLIQVYYTK